MSAGRRKSSRRSWTGSDKTASAKPRAATKIRLKCNKLFFFLLDIWAVRPYFDLHLFCLSYVFYFIFLALSLHLSISLCRELNEINRKHIQDSVALIRGVSTHSSTHTLSYHQQTLKMPSYLLYRTFFCHCHQLYSTLTLYRLFPSSLICLFLPPNPH